MVAVEGLSGSQLRMMKIVGKMHRGFNYGIPVGPNERDLLGRQLDLSPRKYQHLFTKNGTEVSEHVKNYLNRVRNDEQFKLSIQAALAGYDIRIESADDAFWVLTAQAFAKSLVDKTGKTEGNIIHIGTDRVPEHIDKASIFAYTLIKSGICNNGGGIVFHGATDGGSMKYLPMLERAQNGKGGHWGYFTVSHLTKKDLNGLKIGQEGRVMCTDVLMKDIFETIIKGDFLKLRKVNQPENYVVSIGDTIPFRTGVVRNMIEARTKIDKRTPMWETLEGTNVAMPLKGNIIMDISRRVMENLGVKVTPIDTDEVVFDPQETESKNVWILRSWLEARFNLNMVGFFKDPDGDRVALIVLDAKGKSHIVKGTDLLALATENFATYNPQNLNAKVVADMRAALAIQKLAVGLNAKGHKIEVVPSSPGYNSFHEMMKEIDAALGVEETSHTMIRPLDHLMFGAPVHYPGFQGGDNAGLFGIYLLALQKYMWKGNSALEQLAYIRATYNMPHTQRVEYKPKLPPSHGMAKVVIAESINEIAKLAFGDNPNFKIYPIDTGSYIYDVSRDAAVLIRHSKSGSSFTINLEFTAGNKETEVFLANLGVAIFKKAVQMAKIKMADPNHKYHAIRDFKEDMYDAANIAKGIADPDQVINQARQA